ncbi:MAG: rhombosortase [Opitutae bacterium]|nr:rhombosortase [Opitutae bacterium]
MEPALPTGRRHRPWICLAAAAAALLIQLNPAWRDALLYDRAALARGEVWRVWTGHLVHFGWPHFVADTGLLLILGWLLAARHARFTRLALAFMPVFIGAALYWLDPAMPRYGGLSALDLGLLVYLALQGWQRNWADWFWPAVLAIYVGEIIFEIHQGGRGGGMIRFDDPSIQVATSAHLASAACALLCWLPVRFGRKQDPPR